MTRNRFDQIMMVLHFNDGNSMKDKDSPLYSSCHKIQPLIISLSEGIQNISKSRNAYVY